MPTVELFPTAIVFDNPTSARTLGGGAPSVLSALNDGSDATFVEMAGAVNLQWQMWAEFGDWSALPAGAIITGFQQRMRFIDFYQQAGGMIDAVLPHAVTTGVTVGGQAQMESHSAFTMPTWPGASGHWTPGVVYQWDGPVRMSTAWSRGEAPSQWIVTKLNRGVAPAQFPLTGGATWKPRSLYGTMQSYRFYNPHPTGVRPKVTRFSMIVHYHMPPTVNITYPAPAGVVPQSRPTFMWEYADEEGSPQVKYDLWIYKAADVAQTDFIFGDPKQPGAVLIGNYVYGQTKYKPVYAAEEFTATPQAQPNKAIGQDGDGFRAYVRVHHAMTPGQWAISEWDNVDFTLDLATPNVPGLIGAYDPATHGMGIILSGSDNLLNYKRSSMEYVTAELINVLDGYAMSNGVGTSSTTQFLHGSRSLRIEKNTAGAGNVEAITGSIFGGFIDPAPYIGQTLTCLASFRAGTTGRVCRTTFAFFDEDLNTLSPTVTTTTVNDNNAGWQQAKSTVVVPANAYLMAIGMRVDAVAGSSAEFHYIDQVGLFIGNVSTWNQGGWVQSPFGDWSDFELQRSLDVGVTWETIPDTRLTANYPSQVFQYRDYELGAGQDVKYRGRISGTDPEGNVQSSPWSNVVDLSMPVFAEWWLRDIWSITDPQSMALKIRPGLEIDTPKPMSAGYALGDRAATVSHDGVKADILNFEVNLLDGETYEMFRSMIDSGRTLLLQNPFGDLWYVQADKIKYSMLRAVALPEETTPIRNARTVALTMIAVNRPRSFGG